MSVRLLRPPKISQTQKKSLSLFSQFQLTCFSVSLSLSLSLNSLSLSLPLETIPDHVVRTFCCLTKCNHHHHCSCNISKQNLFSGLVVFLSTNRVSYSVSIHLKSHPCELNISGGWLQVSLYLPSSPFPLPLSLRLQILDRNRQAGSQIARYSATCREQLALL